jgi:hypothetical protein
MGFGRKRQHARTCHPIISTLSAHAEKPFHRTFPSNTVSARYYAIARGLASKLRMYRQLGWPPMSQDMRHCGAVTQVDYAHHISRPHQQETFSQSSSFPLKISIAFTLVLFSSSTPHHNVLLLPVPNLLHPQRHNNNRHLLPTLHIRPLSRLRLLRHKSPRRRPTERRKRRVRPHRPVSELRSI